MVSCQNLELFCTLIRETNEVLYDIQQAHLFKDTLKEGIKLSVLSILVAAILGLPLHETIFTGCDRTGLRSHKITHDADTIVDKHGWNLMHVIPDLRVCLRCIRFLTGRRFQLYKHNRHTIQKQQDIGTLFAVLYERPLVRYDKGVVTKITVIHKIDKARALFTLDKIAHFHTMLQIIHKQSIFLHQLSILKILQLIQSICNRVLRHSRIQTVQCLVQFFFIQRAFKITLQVRSIDIPIPHVLKQLYD